MKSAPFNLLAVVIAATGCLSISPIALSQPAERAIKGEHTQHLVCVEDAQGLMCKSENRDHQPARDAETEQLASATESSKVTNFSAPQLISSAHMEQISNLLLGLLYFVLPAGLGLGLFLHDKYSSYRFELLRTQVDLLEKIWKQTT